MVSLQGWKDAEDPCFHADACLSRRSDGQDKDNKKDGISLQEPRRHRCAKPLKGAPHVVGCKNGCNRQDNAGQGESQNGNSPFFSRRNADHRRKDQVSRSKKNRKHRESDDQ